MEKRDIKLIFVVFAVILIAQTGFIIYFFNEKINDLDKKLEYSYSALDRRISNATLELNDRIDLTNSDFQSKINELTQSLAQTKMDLNKEIGTIKAKTSADFSGIIENAVNSVVSIRTNAAQGSGFIITENGYVVTNAHVLSDAKYANAITSNQETKTMKLIGYDVDLDVALLKIDGSYSYLRFDDSDDVKVGEKVIAIGNPLGLSFSVSEGIVSAVNRIGDNGLDAYIQTDAALNPGNSGGPLINTDGKVVGINNFKISGENLGFALESNYIVKGINDIAKQKLNMSIIG